MNCDGNKYLSEFGRGQVELVSFTCSVFVVAALAVYWVCRILRERFPVLHAMTLRKTFAGLFLFSSLGTAILHPFGLSTIQDPPEPIVAKDAVQQGLLRASRQTKLRALKEALLEFAARNNGRFPTADQCAALPPELWDVPTEVPFRYRYVPGRKREIANVLVFEPSVFDADQLVLLTDGTIIEMASADLRARLEREAR